MSHEYLHTTYTPRGVFNELTQETFEIGTPTTVTTRRKAAQHQHAFQRTDSQNAVTEADSAQLMALEAENLRLKGELADALETVDIFKQVVSGYNTR